MGDIYKVSRQISHRELDQLLYNSSLTPCEQAIVQENNTNDGSFEKLPQNLREKFFGEVKRFAGIFSPDFKIEEKSFKFEFAPAVVGAIWGCGGGIAVAPHIDKKDGGLNPDSGDVDLDAGVSDGGDAGIVLPPITLTTVSNLAGPDPGTRPPSHVDGAGAGYARFDAPYGPCITPDGTTLFIVGSGAMDSSVRKITIATQNVTTLAGDGMIFGGDDRIGSAASFNGPRACVVDPSGTNIYLVDRFNNNIRRIVIATGLVTTFVGPGGCYPSCSRGIVDGVGAAARFNDPEGIAIDSSGANLYVADSSNNLIRKIVVATGVVTTFAGSGAAGSIDKKGTAAQFNGPWAITIDSTDTYLYVAEYGGNRIRRINIATQEVSTFAGSGTASSTDGTGTSASFLSPLGITIDPTNTNLYVSDGNTIRKIVIATKVVTTIAGSAASGDTNGSGTHATFRTPYGLVFNPLGTTLYIADMDNNKIRQMK